MMDFMVITLEDIERCPVKSFRASHYHRHGGCRCGDRKANGEEARRHEDEAGAAACQ